VECHRHGSRPHANDARARFRAGLQESQRFLERGADTFTGMARQLGAVETFLETVKLRETGGWKSCWSRPRPCEFELDTP
jgi:hypothetical protein